MFIAGIDVGNYDTKSQHTTIPSGYDGPYNEKPFHDEYLKFDGKYYVLTDKRLPYQMDKTDSDRCIILSLFSLAKEIIFHVTNANNNLVKTKENVQRSINTIREIGLGVGLPPTHYTKARLNVLRDYYMHYMGDGIQFEYSGYQFNVKLVDFDVSPQGGAGVAAIEEDDWDKIVGMCEDGYYVVDIGGYTVDTMKLGQDKKKMKVDFFASREDGVITLFDNIISSMQSNYSVTLNYNTISNVISGKKTPLSVTSPGAEEAIISKTQTYVNYLIDLERQLGVEYKSYPCIFLGGGTVLLKKYILKNNLIVPGLTLFVTNPNANAVGYASRMANRHNKNKG